jgi:hypothetical protein
MRKIEQQMIAAIKERRNWKSGNTAVELTSDGGMFITLYGHIIAEISFVFLGGSVKMGDCGYRTATTRSRLNAVIGATFGRYGVGIFQKDYEWFFQKGGEILPWGQVKGQWLSDVTV